MTRLFMAAPRGITCDRRISKTFYTTDGNHNPGLDHVERYVYDGDGIALVFDGANHLIRREFQGLGTDEILAEEVVPVSGNATSSNDSWLLQDNQGSVRDVVNYTGTLTNHLVYNSYGRLMSQTGATTPRYTYAGRELDRDVDPQSDLYYNRARYYDAFAGRFIIQDPSGFAAGDTNLGGN